MSAPKKKLTRKRLNNALVQVYKNHPQYFTSVPTKMSFFEHVYRGNLDDVQEFIENPEFNINMTSDSGSGSLFFAINGLGGLPMVKLLIENGANINQINYIGNVPIHMIFNNFTTNTLEKIKILDYFVDQDDLILFPFDGRPIERMVQDAIEIMQETYSNKSSSEFPSEDQEYIDNYLVPLANLFSKIGDIAVENEIYINIIPANTKERKYVYIDKRMTGTLLKQYLQRQIFQNPQMNIDFFFKRKLLNLDESLEHQGVKDDLTITYQIRLVSGFNLASVDGGKRKTRRSRK